MDSVEDEEDQKKVIREVLDSIKREEIFEAVAAY